MEQGGVGTEQEEWNGARRSGMEQGEEWKGNRKEEWEWSREKWNGAEGVVEWRSSGNGAGEGGSV